MQNKLINSSILTGNKTQCKTMKRTLKKPCLKKATNTIHRTEGQMSSKYSTGHITPEICIFNFNKAVFQWSITRGKDSCYHVPYWLEIWPTYSSRLKQSSSIMLVFGI